jgi:hypothetical protein
MRNLNWTLAAMVVTLCGAGAVQAAGAPTVIPKVNPAANPPAGKADVYAKGTYAVPGKTINKVVASWYKEDAATGNLTFVGSIDDQAPAGGTYITGDLTVDKKDGAGNPQKYTVLVQVYVDGPGGATDPVPFGPPGAATGFTP